MKQVFWQNSTNDQRPNLKVFIENIEIKSLVDTIEDVSIIVAKFDPFRI